MLTRLSASRRTFAPQIVNCKLSNSKLSSWIQLSSLQSSLVILLFYYHWRNQELLVNFSAFIRENLKLKDEIDKLEDENSELKEHINNNKV